MKTILMLIMLSFLMPIPFFGQKVIFEIHEIGVFGEALGQTSLVDVDNDNDLDWVFGSWGEMYWYEYKSPSNWKLHELGKGAKTDVGGCPIDINQDNWIDFVVGDSWYENTGRPKEERFVLHRKNMIICHDNVVVDIDGDGIKDVVSVSNRPEHPVLAWYRIPTDYSANWDYNYIGEGIHGGIAPFGFGDLDKDDDIDIVRGNVWYANLDGTGLEWKMNEVLTPPGGSRAGAFGLALRTWCVDLDNDDDLDIIIAEADTENGRVFWFENQNCAERFIFHPISSDVTNQDFHSLSVADFDNDGDWDVLSGGGPLSKTDRILFMWENISANGFEWREHVVVSGIKIHETMVADVDKDGDIDICTKAWRGGPHTYLENKLIE